MLKTGLQALFVQARQAGQFGRRPRLFAVLLQQGVGAAQARQVGGMGAACARVCGSELAALAGALMGKQGQRNLTDRKSVV